MYIHTYVIHMYLRTHIAVFIPTFLFSSGYFSAPQFAPVVNRVFSDGPSRLNIELQQPLSEINGPSLQLQCSLPTSEPFGKYIYLSPDDVIHTSKTPPGQ